MCSITAKAAYFCQKQKDSRRKLFGSPQPLQFPTSRWGLIATRFLILLPKTRGGFNPITVFLDRFIRRVLFAPSSRTDTVKDFAKTIFHNSFRHHSIPDSIVSDRDPKFMFKFWHGLMELCDIYLPLSSSHHPKSDGSFEIINGMIENFVRYYCSHHQTNLGHIVH